MKKPAAKIALLAAVATIVYVIALWLVFTHGAPQSPLLMPVVVVVFVIPPIGAWWLIYMVVRHEKQVFPTIMLALVPYGFVWYYSERVRPEAYRSRQLS